MLVETNEQTNKRQTIYHASTGGENYHVEYFVNIDSIIWQLRKCKFYILLDSFYNDTE